MNSETAKLGMFLSPNASFRLVYYLPVGTQCTDMDIVSVMAGFFFAYYYHCQNLACSVADTMTGLNVGFLHFRPPHKVVELHT